MNQSFLEYQIEQLLLHAHIEREAGVDLIEEYFSGQSSLDRVTRQADKLLQKTSDTKIREVILKNLSECIVVKMQYEKRTLTGFFRKCLENLGLGFKNREIKRAEKLVNKSGK